MDWSTRYTGDPDLSDFVRTQNEERILVRRGYDVATTIATLLGAEGSVVGRTGGGRGAHPVVQLPGGELVLLREFRRGGAIRHLNRATYFLGNRAMEELRVTQIAGNRGVSVPRMIAAIERPGRLGYTATLAVGWIDGAVEFAWWLAANTPEQRLALMPAVGAEIARMHAAGISHPDLNLRNLLVVPDEEGSPRVTIIDFDRATVVSGPLPAGRRLANIRRFVRSSWRFGAPLGFSEFEALRAGYGPAWPVSARLG